MSSQEYRKLRNYVLIAFIPIFAAVAYNAAGMHFGMKNKVDRIEMQKNVYETHLLFERKTATLEKMVLQNNNHENYLELKDELDNVQLRIDKLVDDHFVMRGDINKK